MQLAAQLTGQPLSYNGMAPPLYGTPNPELVNAAAAFLAKQQGLMNGGGGGGGGGDFAQATAQAAAAHLLARGFPHM